MKRILSAISYIPIVLVVGLIIWRIVSGDRILFAVCIVTAAVMRVGWFLIEWLSKSNADMAKKREAYTQEVFALSRVEAQQRAEDLLANPEIFLCIDATTEPGEIVQRLSPSMQALCIKYEAIQTAMAHLDLRNIHPAEWGSDFLQVGIYEHAFLAVKPKEDTFYVVDVILLDGKRELEMTHYPSIYHWILDTYGFEPSSSSPI